MRKWLILFLILFAAIGALAVWLARAADDGRPEPGEVRLEVDDVL